jgi:hypothetical protein
MIVVQINSTGVHEIAVEAPTDRIEDVDLALWPIVREELGRLDRRVRLEAPGILARLMSQPPVPGGSAA